MKTRIYVAAIGVPVLLGVIFFLPPWAFGIVLGGISALCAMEFLLATRAASNIRILVYCTVSAFLIPLLQSFWTIGLLGGLFVSILLFLALVI